MTRRDVNPPAQPHNPPPAPQASDEMPAPPQLPRMTVWAPWDDAQVEAIRAWQASERVHPLTCGRCPDGRLDVWPSRLFCTKCGYEQRWVPAVVLMSPPSFTLSGFAQRVMSPGPTDPISELEQLRRWKAEAMAVLEMWDAVGDAVLQIRPAPLGALIPRHALEVLRDIVSHREDGAADASAPALDLTLRDKRSVSIGLFGTEETPGPDREVRVIIDQLVISVEIRDGSPASAYVYDRATSSMLAERDFAEREAQLRSL